MSSKKLFVSRRAVLPEGVKPAIFIVSNGKIESIITPNNDSELNVEIQKYPGSECEDFGESVLMPGIIDTHVHIDEPGHTEWEGFWTATRGAAAGGVTTVIDMPLHCVPPTTTVQNLKLKVAAAHKKIFVDVGFWGGVVPGNQHELKPLVDAGVMGFKCFLITSNNPDFQCVKDEDVEKALTELQNLKAVLLKVNKEGLRLLQKIAYDFASFTISKLLKDDPTSYETFLKAYPDIMEVEAIAKIIKWCESYKSRCHIVHLSSASALGLIREAKKKKLPLTVETCFHYLRIAAEKIPRSATEFKCRPPIRSEANKKELWAALKDHTLDMVVSDYCPYPEDLKGENYLTALAGICSLQFGLSVLWTEARNRDFSFQDVVRVLCSGPAKLSGIEDRKGSLQEGMDADFVAWNPDETIEVQLSKTYHKHPLNPYIGDKLFGNVIATVVRGNLVYKNGQFCDEPVGQLLLKDAFLSEIINA